jgi:hypothetical protein
MKAACISQFGGLQSMIHRRNKMKLTIIKEYKGTLKCSS